MSCTVKGVMVEEKEWDVDEGKEARRMRRASDEVKVGEEGTSCRC